MDTENQLLKLMAENQDVLSQILTTDNRQDAYLIAKDAIDNYSKDDFVHDFNGIQQIIYGEEGTSEELSVDQLETVAGGIDRVYNISQEDSKNIIRWVRKVN